MVSLVVGMMLIGTVGAEDYIVDDDPGLWASHQDIQSAVDAASDGDTIYVYNGTYNENVIVDKNITIIGNGSMDTIVDGGGSGNVFNVTGENVTIMGFNVTNGNTGVNFTGSGVGESNGRIESCVITDNWNVGLFIGSLSRFVAYDNHISFNGDGVWINGSTHVEIINNWIYNNTRGGGQWNDGIRLNQESNNNTIEGNVIFWQDYGIDFYIGTFWDDIVRNNLFYGHGYDGIYAEYLMGLRGIGTSIYRNEFYDNTRGMYLSYSEGTDIYQNDVHNNTSQGIETYGCTQLSIFNNSAYGNGAPGIQVSADMYTNVTYNEIFNNSGYGVMLTMSCTGVMVHHNNFYNNGGTSSQGYDDNNNSWDNGTEGNFWNDYNGTDGNSDGIGDTSYSIDGASGAYDTKPLMNRTDNDAPEQVPEFGMMIVLSSMFALFIAVEARKRRIR